MAPGKKSSTVDIAIPGVPTSASPSLEEPTTPREPLPPKPDQAGPETRTPTGAVTGVPPEAVGQQ
ncbi:MAG: hypothetical protein EOP01_00785, partial [Propionibacteriaceae bacterium]